MYWWCKPDNQWFQFNLFLAFDCLSNFCFSFETKLRVPPAGSFPWSLLWVGGCALPSLYSLLSLHWSLCWVTVHLFYWTQRFLRAKSMFLEHGRYTRNTNRLMFNEAPTQGKLGIHLQRFQEIISQPLHYIFRDREITPNWGIFFHIKILVIVNIFLFILNTNPCPCSCYFLGLYRTLVSLLFHNWTFKYLRRDITFLMSGLNSIYASWDIILSPFIYLLLASAYKKFVYFLPKAWSWILKVVYV